MPSIRVIGALLAVLLAVPPALAQPTAERKPRIARSGAGTPLTAPSSASPTSIVSVYLRANGHTATTAQSIVLVASDRVASTGVTHARFEQRAGDLRVHGSYVKASLTARGELIAVIENLVAMPAASPLVDGIGEDRALGNAMRHLYGDTASPPGLDRKDGATSVYRRTRFFHRGPRVTPVAVPQPDGLLRVGYLVETWTAKGNRLHHTLVGGAGDILNVELRTNTDSYNVFVIDPEKSSQAVVVGPGSGNAESPLGWLSGAQTSINIAGNNANAYLDADANNTPDTGGAAVNDGNFTTAADTTASPATSANRAVAVQNLFYLNNVIHDALFKYGFTEGAGNFQEQNTSGIGAGSDSVNAEAQDGSGTNNANFATPGDGQNPRMQMFLWNPVGTHEVVVSGSSSADGTYVAQGAAFGTTLDTTGITGPIALADDGTGSYLACARLPTGSLSGAVALVDRGTCTFADKVRFAQRAGAIGVIIANNSDRVIISAGAAGGGYRVPVVMISQADGVTVKASADRGDATLRLNASPSPMRDSSLDSDIVWHEYGHGLTWRMIGGMSGPMAGAIGEGMSDVLAVIVNDNDVVGEYSTSDPVGIRSEPYTGYSRTYGDFEGTEIHFDGEIYGAIGWRLWKNFGQAGRTRDQLLTYLVDGMNATPETPSIEDMRDGILTSTGAAGGADDCLVWEAFAHFGVGEGASATVSRRGVVTVIESFDVPAACPAARATPTN